MPGIYTGIGSRQLPRKLLDLMEALGLKLRGKGYKLRTGDAPGADRAFALGASKDLKPKDLDNFLELYAPLGDQRYLPSLLSSARRVPPREGPVFDELMQLLKQYHPSTPSGVKLHTHPSFRYHFRNPLQLFGANMDKPSDFVMAAVNPKYFKTKDLRDLGGTGQNLRIAKAKDIPTVILNPEYPNAKRMLLLDRLRESNPDLDWEKFFKFLDKG